MAKMIGSTNHSIKQVTVAKKGVKKYGEEESLMMHMETAEKLAEEVPTYMRTKVVIGKPTMMENLN